MDIEHGMYFALGFLAAALIAIAIGPAFWRRAVRLTKRRIEAATPVTLGEFRADKDRLRAEFAIALRNKDLRIETLRERLGANVVALDAARTELSVFRTERDEQFSAIESQKLAQGELVGQIRDLERENAAMAARLRQAEADYPNAEAALMPDETAPIAAEQLSGDYRADVEDLLAALAIERQRNGFLEEQARMLLVRIEKKKKSGLKDEAIAMLRDTLAAQTDPESGARLQLRRAEARISGAENRLNALLAETHVNGTEPNGLAPSRLLAEDFSREEHEARVRDSVEALQETAGSTWQTDAFDANALRDKLRAIAVDVSSLVYSEDAESSLPSTESLFDRVNKFAADGLGLEQIGSGSNAENGPLSDRMAALREKMASTT